MAHFDEFHKIGILRNQAFRSVPQISRHHYNAHAQQLADIQLGANVALQNPRTELWDIYGTVVNISPHRRYSVKIQSGHRPHPCT